jgi:hypothetical protein
MLGGFQQAMNLGRGEFTTVNGSVRNIDSAEKPQLSKNEQLKTPLKRSTHPCEN